MVIAGAARQHEPQDVAARGAERLADAELVASLATACAITP